MSRLLTRMFRAPLPFANSPLCGFPFALVAAPYSYVQSLTAIRKFAALRLPICSCRGSLLVCSEPHRHSQIRRFATFHLLMSRLLTRIFRASPPFANSPLCGFPFALVAAPYSYVQSLTVIRKFAALRLSICSCRGSLLVCSEPHRHSQIRRFAASHLLMSRLSPHEFIKTCGGI